ncbi:MAG: hypothetical protein F4107_02675 [Gemmatimonadetes bacterium]|nr:hypothetical protein [Gemmatimonadota bacterium]MDE2679724.1 hypothetical protein [Gemmatimonadota bacterium]MXX34733.1 hypothetical protein [Gemmatimonadota bacterium]MYD13259.1 hypothetical protein [Gemmatimonadota bacterium]MYI64829.1 hypothetical protein [Gemmatimonadota bacterium]
MNEQLRKDVWEAMLDTDRLERYYGRRAAKLARRETVVTGATCAFAVVSAILLTVADNTQWAAVAIVITALVSIVPLLSRLGERVLSAAYCQKRLGDLSIEWSALWQEVEELPTDELRSRWQSLAQRLNEATAHKATEAIDNKLLGLTETESDEYWTGEAAPANRTIAPA